MDTRELQAAIHQAVIDGDTEMVKQLNVTLRRMSTSTQAIDVPHQTVFQSVTSRSPKQISISISAIICFGFLPYWAVAEVLAPGHQGLAKVHEAHWGWVLSPIKGFLPKPKELSLEIPEVKIPSVIEKKAAEVAPAPVENKIVIRAPEDILVNCEETDRNPSVKFWLGDAEIWIYSIESCTSGVIKQGEAIATLSPASHMKMIQKGNETIKNRAEIEQLFGG